MNRNRQPAGTSVGGEFAPGTAGEVDDELEVEEPTIADRQGVEDVLRGYSDFCFKSGDQPDPEVMAEISAATTRAEAEEVVDRLDLGQAIDREQAPGAGPKARASAIRSGYVVNRLRRGLVPSRRHLQTIDRFVGLSDTTAERMFDSFLAGLRASAR